MIVAQRGAGSKYARDGSSLDGQIKELLEQMSCAELKESGKCDPPERDLCAFL